MLPSTNASVPTMAAGIERLSVVDAIGRYGNSELATSDAPYDAHANAESEDEIASTSPEITPGD